MASPTLAPTFVSASNVPVLNGSASIPISGSNLGPGDALEVSITRIAPRNIAGPGDLITVQAAINTSEAGDIVVVSPRTDGQPRAETLFLKPGVRVIPESGTTPKFVGQSDTAIVFPANSNSFTRFEGIEIRAGNVAGHPTKVLVAIKGAGGIRNCILKDMGLASATTGIMASGHSGEISNCTVEMTSHSHTIGQTVAGMELGGVTGPNGSHVVNCSINAKTGSTSISSGIHTSLYSTALIESTLVKADKYGIDAFGGPTIQFCTIDSTYLEGIRGTGADHIIQNCIATHVGHASYPGISGWIVWNCIAPDGVTATNPTGSVTEDPGYCSSGLYTVKVDSYANPSNNPSGKQIGAFPVACVYGTLLRNVIWNGTKPPLLVPGDVTIPLGKSLTLSNGAIVKCGPGDNQGGGNDTQATEIKVQGSLNVSGPSGVHFTSGKTSPVAGDWEGITCATGSTVSIDSAVVEFADTGLDLEQSSGLVKKVLFRKNLTFDAICADIDTSLSLTLDQNRFEVAGSAGIRLNGMTRKVTISNSTIVRSGSSGHGISIGNNTEFATPTITQNTIQGFSTGAGIYIEGGSPIITKNTISTCATGIRVFTQGFGVPKIGEEGNSQSDNMINSNTVGISSEYPGCDPVIRENRIQSNSSGVVAKFGARPDVGKTGHQGKNWISGNTTYCIWNRNVGGNPQISAKYNYFGNCVGGQMPTCWSGSVDISNWLCTSPASSAMVDMIAFPDAKRAIVSVSPNPMVSGGTTLTLNAKESQEEMRVEAFDVAGRLVRQIASGPFPKGLSAISWDGRDQRGDQVPAGIYFIRVKSVGKQAEVARLLVLQRGATR